MSVSTIDRVKQAETEALNTQREAELKVVSIREAAAAKADAIVKEAKENAKNDYDTRVSKAMKEYDSVIKEAKEDASFKAQALRTETLKKQEQINQLLKDTLI